MVGYTIGLKKKHNTLNKLFRHQDTPKSIVLGYQAMFLGPNDGVRLLRNRRTHFNLSLNSSAKQILLINY